MAYIGRDTDKISNVEVLDNITFDGSSSYTLQKGGSNFTPSSANTLLVSIDGVVQAGNFTVSGSTIDFGTAVAGTSTCDFILHYGIGLITTPADGTVTSAKLNLTSAVGIGESSPGTLLDIKGSPGANNRITINSSEAGSNAQVLGGIVIENQGDSVVQISGRRESATDDGYFAIETQATGGALTERVRIHSGGVMSAANGIALGVGTANTASNVLDDYEEGTWTPTFINFSGSGGESQPSVAEGYYTKIGNLVFIGVYLEIPANGDSSALVVSNIPFLSKNTTNSIFGGSITRTDAIISNGTGSWVNDNTNYLYASETNSGNLIDYSVFSGKYLSMVATYLTDA
jgi:hypothetical protein